MKVITLKRLHALEHATNHPMEPLRPIDVLKLPPEDRERYWAGDKDAVLTAARHLAEQGGA